MRAYSRNVAERQLVDRLGDLVREETAVAAGPAGVVVVTGEAEEHVDDARRCPEQRRFDREGRY